MNNLRMEDRSGRFLRWVDESEVKALASHPSVVAITGPKNHRKIVVNSLVEKYDGPASIAALNGQQKMTYTERFAAAPRQLTTLKRFNPHRGTYEEWDEHLTFAEARDGAFESRVTRERRRAARRIAELAGAA